jgi:hypothetical protein
MRAVLLAVVMSLAGCSTSVSDVEVDGWHVGPETSCDAVARCADLLVVAGEGLDRRDPGHAAVVKVTLHDEGPEVDATGGRVVRSGPCCDVALFELADGTVKAIGVGQVGISPGIQAFDYGP